MLQSGLHKTAFQPVKKQVGDTEAVGLILEELSELSELVRLRNPIHQQQCFGKSPKANENSVFVVFIFHVCVVVSQLPGGL